MKKIFFISFLIWIILINIGKIWPISRGEKYYLNLQKWYLLANEGEWEKAKKIEEKIKPEDIENFIKENKEEQLKKRLNEIIVKKEKEFEAIKSAYELDPIREDVSKIYFTFRSSLPQPTRQP